jgi:hypothetical protein
LRVKNKNTHQRSLRFADDYAGLLWGKPNIQKEKGATEPP